MKKKLFWIFTLSASTYFIQGIESLPGQAIFYYFKETLHFSPSKIMYIGTLTGLAWLVKPIIGYFIDNYFTKKFWMYFATILSIMLSFFLGIFSIPLVIMIGILFLNSTNAAFRDVAVDGIMCVEGKQYKETGRIQSVQWIAITIACILTGFIGGYIAEKFSYKFGFLCLIPIYLLLNLVISQYKEIKIKREKTNLLSNIVRYKVLLNRRFVVTCLFMFLYCYAPSFGTPLMFIQRDIFNWSKIWIGILGTIIAAFEIVGALLYFKFGKRINLKAFLIGSIFLGAITTLCYLYYTQITAIVYGIIFCVIGMFIHLIMMDFTARVSITGLEATSFALLCSMHNLSNTASSLSGAYLYPIVGLKLLIIISAFTSFLCLPLVKYLKIDEV